MQRTRTDAATAVEAYLAMLAVGAKVGRVERVHAPRRRGCTGRCRLGVHERLGVCEKREGGAPHHRLQQEDGENGTVARGCTAL
jgi:hypothetical protein